MNVVEFLAAICLGAAALVAAWPAAGRRTRLRALAGAQRERVESNSALTQAAFTPTTGGLTRRDIGVCGPTSFRIPSLLRACLHRQKRSVFLVVALAGVAGLLAGGPVAGVVAAVYGGLAIRTALRRPATREAESLRRRRLDDMAALAADLRAGLPISPAGLEPHRQRSKDEDRLAYLTRAAVRLAERTGAPLAELVERIEADARAADRGLAAAAAQAAGARATAWLLAALPAGGIGLGYAIGTNPLRVLLYTPVGAGCALGALVLQLAGLVWSDRLVGTRTRAA